VATANADAGIVYRTDALDSEQVKIVDVAPESIYSPVVYPVAIIKESKNIPTAKQVLQFLFTKEAQAVFQRNGFLPLDR
jgi:molybdate transport system substrate-binding protein